MKYYAMWFGGSSYAPPTDDDVEIFETLSELKEELRSRYHGRDTKKNLATPAVDETTKFWVWFEDPSDRRVEGYPTWIVKMQPHIGPVIEDA